MKIAQVAPLYVRIPPRYYGGTERVIHWLTEKLVERGHEVTLFASGDSVTGARLIAPCEKALWLEKTVCVPEIFHAIELDMVMSMAAEFDVIHSHLDFWLFPFRKVCPVPIVTTIHGRTDLPELRRLSAYFDKVNLVSISDAQREFLPRANWIETVWHGMPDRDYGFDPEGGEYLAFLARMSPEKRVDLAIEVARRTGIPLKIAARIPEFKPHLEWFKKTVEPLLASTPNVEYIGEVGDEDKYELLRNAKALIAPVDWPEPFGLMFIEAWAVGTPVIARPRGSVPELVRDGEVGFIAETIDDMVRAVGRLDRIDRRACYRYFKENFTSDRMADRYERIYEKLTEKRTPSLSFPRAAGDGMLASASGGALAAAVPLTPGKETVHPGGTGASRVDTIVAKGDRARLIRITPLPCNGQKGRGRPAPAGKARDPSPSRSVKEKCRRCLEEATEMEKKSRRRKNSGKSSGKRGGARS